MLYFCDWFRCFCADRFGFIPIPHAIQKVNRLSNQCCSLRFLLTMPDMNIATRIENDQRFI